TPTRCRPCPRRGRSHRRSSICSAWSSANRDRTCTSALLPALARRQTRAIQPERTKRPAPRTSLPDAWGSPSSGHHRFGDEHEIGGTLRQATHIPRKPLLAVADQCLDAMSLVCEADLLAALNTEQQVELECVAR